ncbi:MAG: YHS domain-containing protein [Chloroflexota bacterium]
MALDPVCGNEVDEKFAEGLSVFRGELYYFCCSGCHNTFDQNPEKYALAPEPTEGSS